MASSGAKRRLYIPAGICARNRTVAMGFETSMRSAGLTTVESPTVDPVEVARFAALAAQWWDPGGKMGMLHKFNPVRLRFIRDTACRQFERDPKRLDSLAGLRILDIGCGGGILSEPLARLGAAVVGADPAVPNIAAAKVHAAGAGLAVGAGLALDYRATTAEALAEAGERFDLVLAMEVVEHVADVALFVERCAEMVKPGGLLIGATINRTLKSFALAIVGAEYVLRWLPRGTHRWDKFVTPNEFEAALERHRLRVIGETGVVYDLLADRWQLAGDMDVNYMIAAQKPASQKPA
jgi:2-polyprenyl-6-hydroxyphenyl methylase/3-demethylubiquinone-9 3-methyltransferase